MGVRDEIARNGAPHARRGLPLTTSQRNVGEQRGQIRKRVHAAKANGPPQTPRPRTTNTRTSYLPPTAYTGLMEELCGFHSSNPKLRYQRPDRAIDVARKWG